MEKITQEWIEEWLQLWPDISPNGYNLRSAPKYCITKMQKFVKDNPTYTKSIIFAATTQYLRERAAEMRNYAYTKQAVYFIAKMGEPSLLAEYCLRETKKSSATAGPAEVSSAFVPEYNPINDFI